MIAMPAMQPAQQEAWLALMDLHERMPDGWALVGGQMVHLHCAERGASPARPTDDADAAVDVRADNRGLLRFTGVLQELGFVPDGESWQGYEHRWVRGAAVIDVLIPRGLHPGSRARETVTGRQTIETWGAQQAVDRAETVDVTVDGRAGKVRRPRLLGALVGKAGRSTRPGAPEQHARPPGPRPVLDGGRRSAGGRRTAAPGAGARGRSGSGA